MSSVAISNITPFFLIKYMVQYHAAKSTLNSGEADWTLVQNNFKRE